MRTTCAHPAAWSLLLCLTLPLCLALPPAVLAQSVEVTPYASYMFGGKISVREGEVDIVDDAAFGAVLAVPVSYGVQAELLFLHQPTSLEFFDRSSPETAEALFDMAVNYYQAGVLYEVQEGWSVPFFSVTLGVSQYAPALSDLRDEWRFAFTVGGGAKLYLTEHFGFRLQGRLLFPMQWGGGSFFCDDSGCPANVASTTSIVQADLSAGVIIRIGDGRPGVR